MNVTIFDTHRFEKDTLSKGSGTDFSVKFLDVRLSAQTASLAAGSEAVVIFVHDRADRVALQALKEAGVRYVALRSAGFNHVDLQAAKELGLKVVRVPEYSPFAVAEHAIALILALNRKVYRAYNRVRELNFSLDGLAGFDLHGRTAGVVGTGRIGAQVARILAGFGCRVLAADPKPDPDLLGRDGIAYVALNELLERSDIISLHAPLTESTKNLINAQSISLMKRGVMIINTSRGGLVKTKDAIDALKTGQIGYLGLDVYEEEEALFFEDHSEEILQDDVIARLLTFPNVLITSHQAFLTLDALEKIAQVTFDNLRCLRQGKKSDNEL